MLTKKPRAHELLKVAKGIHDSGWRGGRPRWSCHPSKQRASFKGLRSSIDYTVEYDRFKKDPSWTTASIKAIGMSRGCGIKRMRNSGGNRTSNVAANALTHIANSPGNSGASNPGTTTYHAKSSTPTVRRIGSTQGTQVHGRRGRPSKLTGPAYAPRRRRSAAAGTAGTASQTSPRPTSVVVPVAGPVRRHQPSKILPAVSRRPPSTHVNSPSPGTTSQSPMTIGVIGARPSWVLGQQYGLSPSILLRLRSNCAAAAYSRHFKSTVRPGDRKASRRDLRRLQQVVQAEMQRHPWRNASQRKTSWREFNQLILEARQEFSTQQTIQTQALTIGKFHVFNGVPNQAAFSLITI